MLHSAPMAMRGWLGRLGAGFVLSRTTRQPWLGLGSSLQQRDKGRTAGGQSQGLWWSRCVSGVRRRRRRKAPASTELRIVGNVLTPALLLAGIAMTWLPLRGVGSAERLLRAFVFPQRVSGEIRDVLFFASLFFWLCAVHEEECLFVWFFYF